MRGTEVKRDLTGSDLADFLGILLHVNPSGRTAFERRLRRRNPALRGRHRRGPSEAPSYLSSGATAACARSRSGAGMTPSCTTPQRATTTANDPATEGTMTAGAPSGSRMYM